MKHCNSFDIDGVIYLGDGLAGVRPHPDDVIITGRSIQEYLATAQMLYELDIRNQVFYNPILWADKTRESSGEHKANTLLKLFQGGTNIQVHFEDDEIQASIIEQRMKEWGLSTTVVRLVHDLTEKENVWHLPK
jgi:hypothetical protein